MFEPWRIFGPNDIAGEPKMSEVLAGGGHKWYRRIGNVDWLRAAWSGA